VENGPFFNRREFLELIGRALRALYEAGDGEDYAVAERPGATQSEPGSKSPDKTIARPPTPSHSTLQVPTLTSTPTPTISFDQFLNNYVDLALPLQQQLRYNHHYLQKAKAEKEMAASDETEVESINSYQTRGKSVKEARKQSLYPIPSSLHLRSSSSFLHP
jgi:DNA segregation ATPase FtsK/SpoIIIE-like protein